MFHYHGRCAKQLLAALLAVCFILTGCSSDRAHYAPPPPEYRHPPATDYAAYQLQDIAPSAFSTTGVSADERAALDQRRAALSNLKGCKVQDRFDRDSALAYNFSDGQSRLALHMDVDGMTEVDEVMLRYRFKFQPDKDKKARCRYTSSFQGLAGSVYNEFVRRDDDTVWDHLEERGLDEWE